MNADASENRHASRMERLYRRWNAARHLGRGSAVLDLESTAWLVGLVSMVPLIPLDSALLGYPPEGANAVFRGLEGWSVALVVTLGMMLQAWWIERDLWARTPEPWTVRRRVRCLRPWLSALPLAGLYVVGLWEKLLRGRPPWAFDAHRVRASYRSPEPSPSRLDRHLRETRPRWLGSVPRQVTLLVPGLVTTFVWAQWLWHGALPSRQLQLVTSSAAFHGLALLSMAYVLRRRAHRSPTSQLRRYALPWLSAFWIVPWPFFGIAGLLLLALFDRSEEALAGRSLAASGHSPRWLALRKNLRELWDREPWWKRLSPRKAELEEIPRATERAARLYLFARLKCLILLADGAALALGFSWLGKRWSTLDLYLESSLFIALALGATAGFVAAAFATARFVRRLLRHRRRRPPYASFIALSGLGLATGIVLGKLIERGEGQAVGGLLLFYGGAGLLLIGLRPLAELILALPPEDPGRAHQGLGWLLGYGSIALLGLNLAGPAAGRIDGLFEMLRFQLPGLSLAGMILSLPFLGWLLRPQKLEDIVGDRSTPRTRCEIVFLTLTAVLPLGGLAAPAWLYLRRQWLE